MRRWCTETRPACNGRPRTQGKKAELVLQDTLRLTESPTIRKNCVVTVTKVWMGVIPVQGRLAGGDAMGSREGTLHRGRGQRVI
jgi:hypothetical protein